MTLLLPNRPGEFLRAARVLGGAGINILGHHLTSEGTFGILQILADNHTNALRALRDEFRAYCSDGEVLLVKIPNTPGSHAEILQILSDHEVNVRNAYNVASPTADALSVMEIQPESRLGIARRELQSRGFEILSSVDEIAT